MIDGANGSKWNETGSMQAWGGAANDFFSFVVTGGSGGASMMAKPSFLILEKPL